LEAAREIGENAYRSRALAVLAPVLNSEERRKMTLTEALHAARGIGDEQERSRALAMLAPMLNAEEQRQTSGQAKVCQSEVCQPKDRQKIQNLKL
jgi:hypothetical protein